MKIAYLSEAQIPSRTASAVHVMRMCEAFRELGHDVTLYHISTDKTESGRVFTAYGVEKPFDLVGLKKKNRRTFMYEYGLRIGWLARRAGADIVVCRNLPGCIVAAALGVPAVYETHVPAGSKGVVTERLFRLLLKLKNVKGVVAISGALREYYDHNYNMADKPILILPDAAAAATARPNIQGSVVGKFNIGYIGQLYEGRGIELLVEIAKRCQWLYVHVIGGEKNDVTSWKHATETIENITFHGYVDPAATETYRQMCDVLVAPYQNVVMVSGNRLNTVEWMSPLKVFEYMASRKAIVSSRIPVLEEVLKDGENALLCMPDDVNDWCEALNRLRQDDNLRKRLAERAYGDFVANYTWEKRAKDLLAFAGHE